MEVSKYTETIRELQNKLQTQKLIVEEKQKETNSKDSALSQARKQTEVYKNKMLEENKAKV